MLMQKSWIGEWEGLHLHPGGITSIFNLKQNLVYIDSWFKAFVT